jgi:hypothetical protein
MKHLLIFADLHGRILLAWKLAERLQRERNIQIDLILQCGDLGAFPTIANFDKATLRHAQRDETELGFSRYFTQHIPEVYQVLQKISCDMWAVRGNHEDHAFLDNLEQQSKSVRYTIDAYQRIFMLPTGKLQSFGNEETINIVGINRIGNRGNKTPNGQPRFIQEYERENLQKLKQNTTHFDILLSHDCDLHFFDKDFGMEEVGECLAYHKPFYHFFGHTGHAYQATTDANGFTTSVKVAELSWEHHGILPAGCMVLLHWKNQYEHTIEPITDAWLKEYTYSDWFYI